MISRVYNLSRCDPHFHHGDILSFSTFIEPQRLSEKQLGRHEESLKIKVSQKVINLMFIERCIY